MGFDLKLIPRALSMDQTKAELVIEWFLDLEARLKQFLRTVPINWNHNAVLPLLSGIIVEAAGLVDSVFRKEFDLSQTKMARKNLNIKNFSDQYEQRFSLSSKKTLIYQYPPVLLNPFFGWTAPGNRFSYTMEWWDAYNKLKHEKIEHYTKSTLNNAVKSLSSLHQVLSVLPCFFRSLIAHDMVALKEYAIRDAIEAVDRGQENMPFLVQSELFATPYGKLQFPDDLSKISGAYFGCSKRLERFLGK